MSSFNCETCGKPCIDTPQGYIKGCEHYPPDQWAVEWWLLRYRDELNATSGDNPPSQPAARPATQKTDGIGSP